MKLLIVGGINIAKKVQNLRKTYILNLDGMRADYYDTQGHQGCLTQTLKFLRDHGVRFSKCKDILPAVTATNHTSILTSTHLGTHGIYGMGSHFQGLDFDHYRISSKHGIATLDKYHHKHLECLPTFFNVVKQNNPELTTALIIGKYWVDFLADESCDILIYAGNPSNPDYVNDSPSYILGGEKHEGDQSFPLRIYLTKKGEKYVGPPKGTIAAPRLATADLMPSDKWIIDQTIQTICHYDPDFMYVLLNNIDTAGHMYGAFTDLNTSNLGDFINPDAMMDQLYITDSQVNRFIEFLKRRETFEKSRIIITSDHGMSTMKEFNRSPDVRKTLNYQNLRIKANTRWIPYGYNDKGDYVWCFSEGPQIYIYCSKDSEQEIKSALVNDLPHYIEILDENDQKEKKMWKGDYQDVIWPRIIVFLEKNYFNIYYGDGYAAGGKLLANMPPFSKLLMAKIYNAPGLPGTHGTHTEQDVPLIFFSPEEHLPDKINVEPGTDIDDEVSVIDIIPTINSLNEWPDQKTFEGKPLFPRKDKPINTN
jgi:arylsulfatase A-like enzyme